MNNQTNSLRSIAAAGPGGRGRPRVDACERAGHERTQENTYSYWDRNGYLHSQCTICRREQQRARRLAHKLGAPSDDAADVIAEAVRLQVHAPEDPDPVIQRGARDAEP